ncbi:hypothetical protein NQ318_003602 [Aromia moschata]|uniref:RRM domain-containing protein n=1 Tax=Aromia moschata TaxID=1265417 RepID=A0AAV8YWH6_9CUCU|nr:hypothetical protein NQ318_003602 [Aromia moschata]
MKVYNIPVLHFKHFQMGTRVFVGGLTYKVRERDIEKFFRKYGRIKEVAMKNGFAFVEFDDHRDADDAIYELSGRDLLGENRISWQDLKDYMRQAGEVTYADAHKQRRNEGIVEFASYKDMKNVIEKLDGTELNGRKIKLIEDRQSKRSRSRSRSSSRSRSRSRSASPSRSRSRSRSKASSKSRSRPNLSWCQGRFAEESKSRSRSPVGKSKERPSSSKSESRSQSPNTTRADI